MKAIVESGWFQAIALQFSTSLKNRGEFIKTVATICFGVLMR
jgi:hypothetical protein